MKDAIHHLKHVQRKVVQSMRKEKEAEQVEPDVGGTVFERNVKSRDKLINRRKSHRLIKTPVSR